MTRRRALTIIILLILIGLLSALAGVLFGLVKLPELITSYPWVALLLVGVALGGLGFWLYRAESPEEKLPLRRQNRQRMLERVRMRITKQLADSLQGATLLELGLHEQPNAVISFSPFSLQHPDQLTQPMSSQTRIFQAYQEAEEQLLILGEPGAGKTTLLLELARDLLERAQQDENAPIPVVFNLSSWAVKQQELGAWMAEELGPMYQISHDLGKSWVKAQEMQPLLDGLDEVAQEHRTACVDAINAYRDTHGLAPPVVCCRKDDYFNQPRRLQLQSAVLIEPLSQQQIDTLLSSAGEPLSGLRQALATDANLHALAPIPLMLNLMILAYEGRPAEEILQYSSLSTRQQQVLTDYVQRRLQRRGAGTRYTSEQTLRWLGWLARQMQSQNQSIFYTEQLQPDRLAGSQRVLYQWSVRLIVGLINGLFFGLTAGLVAGLIFRLGIGLFLGLVVGLIAGLIFMRLGKEGVMRIEPAEALIWSWKDVLSGLVAGLIAGLIIGLVAGLVVWLLFGLATGLLVGQIVGVWVGLFFGSVFGLFGVIRAEQLTERHHLSPNKGIWLSAKNGLLFILVLGSTFGLAGGLSAGLVSGLLAGLLVGVCGGLAVGLIVGLEYGGESVIQHITLRIILWRTSAAPWHYVRFLDSAAERILLRKVGGGYIFVHRLLQVYFATLDTTSTSPSKT